MEILLAKKNRFGWPARAREEVGDFYGDMAKYISLLRRNLF